MSTKVYEEQAFSLTQFAGGKDRGVCIQITTGEHRDSYVSFSRPEATRLVEQLWKWLAIAKQKYPVTPA